MSRLPKNPDPFDLKKCFIAGGAILSMATKTEINDYDIYPKSSDGLLDAIHTIMDNDCFLLNVSDRALTFKSNTETKNNGERMIVQVMTYDFFESADKIFENFDFTVTMGAFDCDSHSYVTHEDFYPDAASRTLRFNPKTKYPLNSMLRVSKYQTKGFYMSKPEQAKLALTVAKAGLPNSWEELESQIGGSYGREIELARKDAEFSFDNAIEVLSDMLFDFDHYIKMQEDDYSKISAEEVAGYFDKSEKVKMIVLNAENEFTSSSSVKRYLVAEDYVQGEISSELIEKFGMPNHYQEMTEGRLYGYKVLSEKDGKLFPAISSKNGVFYEIGDETEWATKPYLFVFKTHTAAISRCHYNKNKMFLVSYDLSDIKNISNDEIQVTKMRIEKEISLVTDQKTGKFMPPKNTLDENEIFDT